MKIKVISYYEWSCSENGGISRPDSDKGTLGGLVGCGLELLLAKILVPSSMALLTYITWFHINYSMHIYSRLFSIPVNLLWVGDIYTFCMFIDGLNIYFYESIKAGIYRIFRFSSFVIYNLIRE